MKTVYKCPDLGITTIHMRKIAYSDPILRKNTEAL